MPAYSHSIQIGLPFDRAVAVTRAALKEEDFGVVMEIDFQKTIQQKLGKEIRPYLILGACVPDLAHRAIQTDPEIGVLMPCNVCVWDNGDGSSTVSAINVETLFALVDNPELAGAARIIQAKLDAVLAWVRSERMFERAKQAA